MNKQTKSTHDNRFINIGADDQNETPNSQNTVRVSRRSMLAVSAATAVGLSAGNAFGAPKEKKSRKENKKGHIDAHVHVWTSDTDRYPLDRRFAKKSMQPPTFTPRELMEHASRAGVDRVVLIQMSFYGFDNSYMLDVMENHPGQFSGVAVIDTEAEPAKAMKDLMSKGVRGFRIVAGKRDPDSWLRSKGMQKMWNTAADEGLAICPLMNPEYISSINKMCKKFPKTRVVVDHFARIGVTGTIHKQDVENLCKLAENKNIYVKTSAFYALGKKKAPYRDLGAMIRSCKDAFGSQRLMWATDCPYQVQGEHTYLDSIDLIKSGLDFLTDEDRKWILQKTAEHVFFS